MRFCVVAALAAVTVSAMATGASASINLYSNRAAFVAGAPGLTTLTFDGIVPAGFDATNVGPLQNFSGASFDGASVGVQSHLSFPGQLIADDVYGSDYLEWEDANPQVLTVHFETAVNAVGFDFMEVRGHASLFTIGGAGGSFQVLTGGTSSFFGLFSDVAFDTLTISAPADGPVPGNFATLDNFSFGALRGGVPEPGAWALMLVGFGGLGAMLRRDRRRAKVSDSGQFAPLT